MLTRSRSMAAPEAAGELAGIERVNDSPRQTTTADTAPKRDRTLVYCRPCSWLAPTSCQRFYLHCQCEYVATGMFTMHTLTLHWQYYYYYLLSIAGQ